MEKKEDPHLWSDIVRLELEDIMINSGGYRCKNKYVDKAKRIVNSISGKFYKKKTYKEAILLDLNEKYMRKFSQRLPDYIPHDYDGITVTPDIYKQAHTDVMNIIKRYARAQTYYARKTAADAKKVKKEGNVNIIEDDLVVTYVFTPAKYGGLKGLIAKYR